MAGLRTSRGPLRQWMNESAACWFDEPSNVFDQAMTPMLRRIWRSERPHAFGQIRPGTAADRAPVRPICASREIGMEAFGRGIRPASRGRRRYSTLASVSSHLQARCSTSASRLEFLLPFDFGLREIDGTIAVDLFRRLRPDFDVMAWPCFVG